jgi:hypothetical protein
MNLEPLLVDLRIPGVDTSEFFDDDHQLYLWVIFFKIDGESVTLELTQTPQGPTFNLQGTAIISDRPGDRGDLQRKSPDVQFLFAPVELGVFRTTLKQISPGPSIPAPLAALIPPIPGTIGCVALVVYHFNLSDDVIAQGHAALNSSFQQQINQFIPTLGVNKQTVTQADINTIQAAIVSNVTNTITNALLVQVFTAIFAILGIDHVDFPMGTQNYSFISGGFAALFSQNGQGGLLSIGSGLLPKGEVAVNQENTIKLPAGQTAGPPNVFGNRPLGPHTNASGQGLDSVLAYAHQLLALPFPLSLRRFLENTGFLPPPISTPPPISLKTVNPVPGSSFMNFVNQQWPLHIPGA